MAGHTVQMVRKLRGSDKMTKIRLTTLFHYVLRDVGYMRICDRTCDRIFWQKVQIAYFSAYNGIFKIAYVENTPHMLKFAYIAQISACAIAFFSIIPTDVDA